MTDLPPPPITDGTSAPGPRLPAPPATPPPPAPGGGPVRRPSALRAAWPGFVLVLVNAPIAGWFAVWGLDGVNHCDDPSLGPAQDCGLGFAVLIPLAWVFTFLVVAGTFGLGFVRLPRWAAWGLCLVAIALVWAANVGAMSAYEPRR